MIKKRKTIDEMRAEARKKMGYDKWDKIMMKQQSVEHLRGHYACKDCGKTFDTLPALGTHANQHRAEARKIMFGMSRMLNVLPDEVPKDYKIVTVEYIGTSTRIASSYFIQKGWERVAIHKPIKQQNGIWIYIEPIEVKQNEPNDVLPIHGEDTVSLR